MNICEHIGQDTLASSVNEPQFHHKWLVLPESILHNCSKKKMTQFCEMHSFWAPSDIFKCFKLFVFRKHNKTYVVNVMLIYKGHGLMDIVLPNLWIQNDI